MEEYQPQPDEFRQKPRRMPRFLKYFSGLAALAVFFGVGVAVGRGNIHIRGLSQTRIVSPTSAFDYSSVDRVYTILRSDFDGSLNKNKLLDGIKSGLVGATGDPYTQYFNPNDAKQFNEELSGSFTGIGAELGTDSANNIVIVSPLSGYPAEQAGLKPKDVIAAVNDQNTTGLSVDAVVRKIRGPADTAVKLTVIRANGKPFDVSIKRVQITVPSVKYQVDGAIGYIKISQFTNDTANLAQKAAAEFKDKKVKGVVLDLRSDPGGYLDGAVTISSMWLDQGKPVVSERRGATTLSTKYASGVNPFKGLPTVILVNGGSASAAEITAGALHDNNAGTIVGTKTFGKGSVQEVEDLPDGAELKVTVARWYTPAGKNIDKQGITPDTIIDISDADKAAGKDPQKDKAYQVLQSKL